MYLILSYFTGQYTVIISQSEKNKNLEFLYSKF